MSSLDNLLLLFFALFLVLLNGFFVAAEFAIVKVRHTRVEELSRVHGFKGRILLTVHRNLDAYLSACQLGITLSSLGLGWVGEPAFASLLEIPLKALGWDNDPESTHFIAFIIAFATISYLHIVIGELAPKSAALRRPEAMSLWTAVPLFSFYWLMFPFIWFLNHSANAVLRRFGLQGEGGHGHEVPYTLDELRMILHLSRGAGEDAKPGDSEISRVLAHAIELPQLHASDVMRNRRELAVIRSDQNGAEVRRLLQHHRYSRYPYVDADSDEILGVLHHKDIVFEADGEDYASRLRRHLRAVEKVGEDRPIDDLLRQFRLGAPHLALVVDDQGRVIGFVTMEDVLEAVFGEIRDEHEQARSHHVRREPKRMGDGSVLVRGDTPLFMVERELGIAIPESETISTVTGLFMERLGQMPRVQDRIELDGYVAEILRARGAAIEAARLTPVAASTAGDGS